MPIESSQYFIRLLRDNQVFTFYHFIDLTIRRKVVDLFRQSRTRFKHECRMFDCA